MIYENETRIIIQCAIKIHKRFGPGLLESAYRALLVHELRKYFEYVQEEVHLPIIFEDVQLHQGYRIDILINNRIVIELKAVDSLNEVHLAQILTYLKIGKYPLGLLINFNVKLLKTGIRRVINNNIK